MQPAQNRTCAPKRPRQRSSSETESRSPSIPDASVSLHETAAQYFNALGDRGYREQENEDIEKQVFARQQLSGSLEEAAKLHKTLTKDKKYGGNCYLLRL